MSQPQPAIPPAVLTKCFIPYSPNSRPSLHGVPVGPVDANLSPSIGLAPGLLSRGVAAISEAFTALGARRPLSDSTESHQYTLPVTVICSPHLNSPVAVDAAVRYIAHCVEADVVILDPADLAAGRRGVLGEDLTDAFWQLYCRCDLDSNSNSFLFFDSITSHVASGGSASAESQTTEVGDSSLVREFFLMRSTAQMNVDASNNRRRILYLRDYGALCKALLPLLGALYDAISSGPPMLIVAGISPIQRVTEISESERTSDRKSTQYKRFLDQMDGEDTSFKEYLHTRYCASWRKPAADSSQYRCLEDIFTALFINRYQGKGINSRRRDLFTQRSRQMKLQFTLIVRVGLLYEPPRTVQDALQSERRKRFLLANLWLIRQRCSYFQDELISFGIDQERYVDQGDDLKAFHALTSHVLNNKQLEHIARTWPLSPELGDILRAVNGRWKDDTREWRQMLRMARSGQTMTENPERVVRITVESLNQYEKQLLSCVVDPATIRTTFADVCVKPEIIDTLRTAVSYPILFPQAYTTGILAEASIGGVLLFGPPGTGKTMACRALAKECGAQMLHLQASTIQNCHVGETEKLVSAAFSLARRRGPCVIFIDEIDALFSKRDGSSKPWHRTMVTEFTQEMDGLNTADANQQAGLIVIGASNRPQDIDSAVVRRLSRRILVDLPTLQQRKVILNQYLNGELSDQTVNVDKLAGRTPLFSGSDLRHLVHSAALAALKDGISASGQILFQANGSLKLEPSRTPLPPRVIQGKHFEQALKQVSAISATNRKDLDDLRRWANELFQSDYCS